MVPIRKKGEKETLKNYRSMSLLLLLGKILERLIFNGMLILTITKNGVWKNK